MILSTPAMALEAQGRYASYLQSPKSRELLELFARAYGRQGESIPQITNWLINNTQTVFSAGKTILLTSEAGDLVKEATETLPDEVLLEADLFEDTAVIWLETPLEYTPRVVMDTELVTEKWTVRAIGIAQEASAAGPNLPPTPGVILYVYGDSVGNNPVPVESGLLMTDVLPFRFGSDWNNFEGSGADWVVEMKRWFVALCRLMGEHIERTPERLDRAARRRELRRGRPEDGYLSVLRLRKVVYSTEADHGSGASLRFRHRVRGHWRKFYCPSTKLPTGDPGAYRHRYVNDYIRGPQGSEFVESTQVISISR